MSGAAPPYWTTSSNGVGVVPDALLNGFVQAGGLLANARAFNNALSGMTINLLGLITPQDGGQGDFWWNPTSTAADDGGLTVIQPNGLILGRWLRLNGGTSTLFVVPNIATLRGLTSGIAAVMVEGYYAPGDGGGGLYIKGASASDNGGTIITSGNGTYYLNTFGQPVSIKQFGAKGDGTTDDTTAWQKAINALQGTSGVLSFPACITVVSQRLPITAPLTIQGAGSGAGPGLLTTDGASVILCKNTFTTGDVFSVTGYYQCIFRDFQMAGALGLTFLSASPRTTGAAIRISAPNPGTSTNLRSIISNIAFSGFYECIHCTLCADQIIESCYFQAWKNAAYAEDEGGSTPESAGGSFTKNKLFGDPSPGTTQVVGIHIENGYTWIRGNTILGSQYGIRVQIQGAVASATHLISNNALEEQTVKSIEYSFTANTIVSVLINNNEFSQIANVAAFQSHISFVDPGFAFDGNISIAGNTINSFITNAGCVMINIQAGFNVTVNNNVINNNSAVGLGSVFATGGHIGGAIAILDNIVNGVNLANIYNLDPATKVRDKLNNLLFADLGAWGGGSEVNVIDGQATSATNAILIGGGSGATASRVRNLWFSNQYGVTG